MLKGLVIRMNTHRPYLFDLLGVRTHTEAHREYVNLRSYPVYR